MASVNHTTPSSIGNNNAHIMSIIDDVSKYISFTTALFGLAGSFMIILIMTRKPFSHMPRSLFCVTLALIDIVYLCYQVTFASCRLWFDTYPGVLSRYTCKINYCFVWMSIQVDAWLVCCLAGERVLAIYRPLEVKRIVTKKRVKVVLAVIFGVLLAWNAEALYRYDLAVTAGYKICSGVNTWVFSKEAFKIKDRLTESLKTFIPVILVTLCNVAIFVKLYQVRKHRHELGASNVDDNENQRMNVMIISLTILYVILVAPSSVYTSIHGLDSFNDPFSSILFQISLLNPSVNFYVYFVSGTLFRTQVLKFCRSSKKGQGNKMGKNGNQGQKQQDDIRDSTEASNTVLSETSVHISDLSKE